MLVEEGLSSESPLIHNENKPNDEVNREDIVSIDAHSTFATRNTTSFFSTCFHCLNALSGVGILSIPYALASGGWLSLICLFLLSMAASYSGLLIKRCMDVDSNIMTYPDIGKRAFGEKGRLMISIFIYLELYLFVTGLLILEGDNLQKLLPNITLEVGGLLFGGRQMFVIIVALLILPTVWLDNLRLLSYVSVGGVLTSLIIPGSIIWTGALDGVGFNRKGVLIDWSGLPTALSLYVLCYCGHSVFPTLYTSMQKKNQFSNVLFISFSICTLVNAAMAVFGYLMFGSELQSQITLNLPVEKLSSKVAIYTALINPISKYALMVTPIIDAINTWIPSRYNRRRSRLLIGTTIVISTVAVALAIPFFGYLMSLIGAFTSMTASIMIPCLCYLKISGSYKRFGLETLANLAIIFIGGAIAIIGTYVSLAEIINGLLS